MGFGLEVSCLRFGGYAAFLQNAGGGAVGDPERCSGLVYGVPLGHVGRGGWGGLCAQGEV